MKKTIFSIALLSALSTAFQADAYTGNFTVKPREIVNGYVIERIWLQNNAVPAITLSNIVCTPASGVPSDVKPSDPQQFQVVMGMDRIRPFLVLRVPAFS